MNIVQRAEKAAFCKGPGCVLIDDFPKNVDEWRSLGGTALLFDKSMTEEVETLNKKLAELTDDELAQVTGGIKKAAIALATGMIIEAKTGVDEFVERR